MPLVSSFHHLQFAHLPQGSFLLEQFDAQTGTVVIGVTDRPDRARVSVAGLEQLMNSINYPDQVPDDAYHTYINAPGCRQYFHSAGRSWLGVMDATGARRQEFVFPVPTISVFALRDQILGHGGVAQFVQSGRRGRVVAKG